MELDDVVRRRRMCRDFADRPVSRETVDALLDKARRAPSAGNTQGWSFLVLEEAEQTSRFWSAVADKEWLGNPTLPGLLRAPVVVVPMGSAARYAERYAEPDKAGRGRVGPGVWPVPYWTVDVAFATMILLLAAVEEGLGSLFLGRDVPAYERLRSEFGVPPEWQPIGAVLLGWPSQGGGPRGSGGRRRRPIEDVVHRGGW